MAVVVEWCGCGGRVVVVVEWCGCGGRVVVVVVEWLWW